MAGSRLLSQIVLLLTTIVLFLVSFNTLRLGRYFYSDNSFSIPSLMTQQDWIRFFDAPRIFLEISQHSFSNQRYKLATQVLPRGVSDLSHEQVNEEFWRGVDNLSEYIPPSREIHLNIILGSESEELRPETIQLVRQTVMRVRESLQTFHQLIPMTMSLRFIRNLHWQSFLKKSIDHNFSCSSLSAKDIIHPPKGFSFSLSSISSPGVVGSAADALSCDYQTQLCSSITILIYVPSPHDQPLELVDSIRESSTSSCPRHSNQSITSNGLIFPSRHLAIVALNDHWLMSKDSLSSETQNDLTNSVLDQLHAFFATGAQKTASASTIIPFDLSTSWSQRLLLVRWLSLLHSDTLIQLNAIRSLHSPSDPTAPPVETGSYFPLSADKMKVVTGILKRLDLFETCSMHSENSSFDLKLACAHEAILDSNLRARGLLSDPSLVNHRREGIEMISAILLPFWFPILIPLIYGTFYEVRRYFQKRKGSANHCQ
jgi:hypothetical protein